MVVFKKIKIAKSWEDIQPKFPRFGNLHLEMLETEKKLRPNLPPIPLSTYKGAAMNSPAQFVHGGGADRGGDRGGWGSGGGSGRNSAVSSPGGERSGKGDVRSPGNPGKRREETPFQDRQQGDYRGAPTQGRAQTPPPQPPLQTPLRNNNNTPPLPQSQQPLSNSGYKTGDPVLDAIGADERAPPPVPLAQEWTQAPPLYNPAAQAQHSGAHPGAQQQPDAQASQPGPGQPGAPVDPSQPPQETDEEKEKKLKEEHGDYLYKLKFLRRQYPDIEVPPYSEHSDLETLRKIYNDAMREITRDNNFDSYKGYLQASFLLIEFTSTQFFGVDMTGFAQTQATMMTKYDRLLLELGEKSSGFGSSLPVEIRLIGLILINTGIFYIGKLVAEKGGDNVVALFASIFGPQVASKPKSKSSSSSGSGGSGSSGSGSKKKRKGPSVTAKDIENMDD